MSVELNMSTLHSRLTALLVFQGRVLLCFESWTSPTDTLAQPTARFLVVRAPFPPLAYEGDIQADASFVCRAWGGVHRVALHRPGARCVLPFDFQVCFWTAGGGTWQTA